MMVLFCEFLLACVCNTDYKKLRYRSKKRHSKTDILIKQKTEEKMQQIYIEYQPKATYRMGTVTAQNAGFHLKGDP